MNLRTALASAAALCVACASGPQLKPAAEALQLKDLELEVYDQGFEDFGLRLTTKATADVAAVVEKATYEVVVEGQVVHQGEQALNAAIAASGAAPVQLEARAPYTPKPEDLQAVAERGGRVLAALRGTLSIRRGQQVDTVPFARSREVRVPRLPTARLRDFNAARYSPQEATATFYMAVENPNPFPLKLEGLSYDIQIAGKSLAKGTLGQGEKVNASSTGVFEAPQVVVNAETYGPQVASLIKTQTLPYLIQGELKTPRFAQAYEVKGDIQLNTSR